MGIGGLKRLKRLAWVHWKYRTRTKLGIHIQAYGPSHVASSYERIKRDRSIYNHHLLFSLSSKAVVLNGKQFCPQPQSKDIFVWHTWVRTCYQPLAGKGQGCCQTSCNAQYTLHNKEFSGSNISNVMVEKPWSKVNIKILWKGDISGTAWKGL